MTKRRFLLLMLVTLLLGGVLSLTPALAGSVPPTAPPPPMGQCDIPIPDPSASLSVSPTALEVGQTTTVSISSQEMAALWYTLYDGSYRIAKFSAYREVEVYNESPVIRFVSGVVPSNYQDPLASAVLEAIAPGTADLSVMATGTVLVGYDSTCSIPFRGMGIEYSNDVPVSITNSIQPYPNVYYKIVNKADGLVVDSGGTTTVGSYAKLWADVTHDNLRWQLSDQGGGWYKIINKADGLMLDSGGTTTGGSYLKLWSDATSDNLLWQIVPAE